MEMELDFQVEARNARRTAELLRHRRDVRVPEVPCRFTGRSQGRRVRIRRLMP